MLSWPVVPIHMALTPQGDIMSFGTNQAGAQGGDLVYDVWDPETGAHSVKPNSTPTDIFCAIQVVDPNSDQLLTAGGDNSGPGNAGNPGVTVYSDASGSLRGAPEMNTARWYPTANVLPSGEIVVQGGSLDSTAGPGVVTPEIRRPDGTWKSLTGASSSAVWGNEAQNSWWYPRSWVAPDGRLFGIAGSQMYYLDPSGLGSIELAGGFPGDNIMATSTAVMFRPGQILQVGGGAPANGVDGAASASATVVDLNGGNPELRSVAPMSRGRHWATSTVLADGTVLVTGGAAGNNTLDGVAYNPELWDPETNTWTALAPEGTHRLYHSAAILLPDGRVLSGGGGAPGPTDNLDAQIFSPPYLFEADGSPAARPVITSSPSTVSYGSTFDVNVSSSATEFALVRAGTVTHSFNNSQMYIPIDSSGVGGARTLTAPASGAVAPPGTYLLFALDADGTPSVASMLKINPEPSASVEPEPEPGPFSVSGGPVVVFDFEGGEDAVPGGWVNFDAGDSFGSWSVLSAVSKDQAGHHGGSGVVGHHVDLDDDGVIEATVSGLVPGVSYVLSFDTAKHFLVGGSVSAEVSVDGVVESWSPSGLSTDEWESVSVSFTASGSSVPIVFSGSGSPVPWGGVLIDNATITPTG